MPEIKQFFATNQFRADDTGSRAYETLGRRVGGQYGAAGNDIRDIGRMKAATINMLGRWPQNILELEKREAERAFKRQQYRGPQGGEPTGGVRSISRGGSVTDSQFAPRYHPNMAALNEMSEGARQFGNALGSGIALGYQRPDYPRGSAGFEREQRELRREREQSEREEARQLRLDQAAYEKRWDLYEKDLNKHNEDIRKDGVKYTEGFQGPTADYGGASDPNMTPGQVTNDESWFSSAGRSIVNTAYETFDWAVGGEPR